MSAPNEFLTVAAAAARLGQSSRTVARWCARGRIPSTRIGHRYLIHANVLTALELQAGAEFEPPGPAFLRGGSRSDDAPDSDVEAAR
jgi:excisionase family DNA binding protein